MKKSSQAGQKVSSAVLSLMLHVLIGLMIGRHLPHPVLLQAFDLSGAGCARTVKWLAKSIVC